GDGQRDAELLVKHPGRALQKRHRQKHRRHYQRDAHDGPAYLAHGVDGRPPGRRIAVFELGVHGFYYHDGIIHHDADGQYQGKERQDVNRIAKNLQEEERADNGHRHR
nr:hypothetical protein [Tanacetum cinerariifolium]